MKKNKRKSKIKISRVIIFLLFLYVIISSIYSFFNMKITNIVVLNNNYLKDQEIIEIAGLSNYPSTLQNGSRRIENKLRNNVYIKDVNVTKQRFKTVHIEVIENRPLFFYSPTNKTILLDGTSVEEVFPIATVLNYIVDSVYDDFVKELAEIDVSIARRISEIEYSPNNVDASRFFLTMTDGNYVYINVQTFFKLNRYLEIIRNFPNQNGVLYLDYGNNFEIID